MSDILTPMPDDHIGRLALIEAMRASTDAVQRLARQVETQDGKLEGIKDQLAEMKTSIALLQQSSLKSDVEDLKTRLGALEASQQQQRGALGLFEWVLKNWPGIIGFFVLLAFVAREKGLI